MAPPAAPGTTAGGIPKRDWIVLPAISLLTILSLCGLAEWGSRIIWPEYLHESCGGTDALGMRPKAFCSEITKNAEGPWVRYEYNACGYRGRGPCGPKPAGTVRFVILGTSIAKGVFVEEQDLFSSRAAGPLAKVLGHPVEFQNLGNVGPVLADQPAMLDEVKRLQPNGVFLMIAPFDLRRMDPPPPGAPPGALQKAKHVPWLTSVVVALASSRAVFMAQHFLLQDEAFVVRSFRNYTNPDDISHIPASAVTEERLARLETLIGRLAGPLRERGVRLYVIPFPNLPGAALISQDVHLPDADGEAFSRRVSEAARRQGAEAIDPVPELRAVKHPASLFYTADGHPAAGGYEIMARAVIKHFEQAGAENLTAAADGR